MQDLKNIDKEFSFICLLNGNGFSTGFNSVLGYSNSNLSIPLEKIKSELINDKIFGFLSYELKNEIKYVESSSFEYREFSNLYFFLSYC